MKPQRKRLKDVDLDYELELERELAREEAREGIGAFTAYTKKDYQPKWFQRKLDKVLDDWIEKKPGCRFVIVTLPPRHGKSEKVSRRLPAYILGKYPDRKVIAGSHTADLASSMNRDVQRIIDSKEYVEVFPGSKLSGENVRTLADGSYLRNSNEFEIVNHKGGYKCTGVGGALAGRGGDYLVLDDPIKDHEEAESPVYREKLWNWYNTVFDTRGEKDYCVLITVTRWHEDDLVGRLLKLAKEDPEATQWKVINFPAIKEKETFEGDPRAIGEALWPEKYSEADLLKKKKTGGSRVFNSIYQQRPSSEFGDILKRQWTEQRFSRLPDLGEKNRWDEILTSGDLRFKSDKNSGDYVVLQAWARLGAAIYFLGEHRGRWGFVETIKEFGKINQATPIGRFRLSGLDRKLVENKANGPALEDVLKSKISGIVLVEPDGGKVARTNAVTPLWEAGNVWLPDSSLYPEIDDIVEEWVSFGPGCAFDDRTDTMSQALNFLGRNLGFDLESLTKM